MENASGLATGMNSIVVVPVVLHECWLDRVRLHSIFRKV